MKKQQVLTERLRAMTPKERGRFFVRYVQILARNYVGVKRRCGGVKFVKRLLSSPAG